METRASKENTSKEGLLNMQPTLGAGFRLGFRGLLLKAEFTHEGWSYHISEAKTNNVFRNWTPSMPSVSEYMEPESTKFQAIEIALALLRSQDDPHAILRESRWMEYGPGH